MTTDKKICKVCPRELPDGSRSDKQFCSDACRNKWNNKRKGKIIGKAKVTGMELLLNKIMWKLEPHELWKIIGEANDIPKLPGNFYHDKAAEKINFQYTGVKIKK